MTADDQIRDEKLNHGITRETVKISLYHQTESVNMNILQEKKYCHLMIRK